MWHISKPDPSSFLQHQCQDVLGSHSRLRTYLYFFLQKNIIQSAFIKVEHFFYIKDYATDAAEFFLVQCCSASAFCFLNCFHNTCVLQMSMLFRLEQIL